jgi:uncharacterized protein involved in type VI secretion and phage assembly
MYVSSKLGRTQVLAVVLAITLCSFGIAANTYAKSPQESCPYQKVSPPVQQTQSCISCPVDPKKVHEEEEARQKAMEEEQEAAAHAQHEAEEDQLKAAKEAEHAQHEAAEDCEKNQKKYAHAQEEAQEAQDKANEKLAEANELNPCVSCPAQAENVVETETEITAVPEPEPAPIPEPVPPPVIEEQAVVIVPVAPMEQPKELPRTAGSLPLIALIGFALTTGSLTLLFRRR